MNELKTFIKNNRLLLIALAISHPAWHLWEIKSNPNGFSF